MKTLGGIKVAALIIATVAAFPLAIEPLARLVLAFAR
jgi:hypothetical protein